MRGRRTATKAGLKNVADNELSCQSKLLLWLRKQSGNCHRTCQRDREESGRGGEREREQHSHGAVSKSGSFVFGFGKLQKPRKN